jgi:hypothetical protein
MKISNLVAYRNLIDEVDKNTVKSLMLSQVLPIKHLVETTDPKFPNIEQELAHSIDAINSSIDQFNDTLQRLRDQLQLQIADAERIYLKRSNQLYHEGRGDSSEYVLNRRPDFDESTKEFISGRINANCDWRKVGLIIRPGLEDWISQMVSLDPLYLADTDAELLKPVSTLFNQVYQTRLRKYVFTENPGTPFLTALPDTQFGVVFVYNFFHYKTITVIHQYLAEIYQKLSPGGVLMMTFNDCDRSGGVKLAENNFMCYTTHSQIIEYANTLGFQHRVTQHLDAAWTFLELIKPGEKVSLRGGQVLGEITHISYQKN